jgi:hypothetical protein
MGICPQISVFYVPNSVLNTDHNILLAEHWFFMSGSSHVGNMFSD